MMTFYKHRSLACVIAVLSLLNATAHAIDVFTISNFVLAPTAVSKSSSGCFVMSGTLGQPLVDLISSQNYDLDSGFWALLPTTGDSIFAGGFQNCSF
jgi:hypothetical protein